MLAGVLGYDLFYGGGPADAEDDAPATAAREAVATEKRRRGLGVELLGVRKGFAGRTVLDNFDLTIAPGSFVAVIGRSGEGKSTLLRLLAGLEQPQSGRVLLDGAPPGVARGDVTMMFQDARLLPWQRVLGNVGIARGPEWRARAQAALAAVGLADRAQDWPARLSGGQRQRVALARALLDRPGLLLLDEPFAALDALTRREMHRLMLRLWRASGFTAVLVTHDVTEAVTLADRVLVLRAGSIAHDVIVDNDTRHTPDRAATLHAHLLGLLT